jgi:hypothetical protein
MKKLKLSYEGGGKISVAVRDIINSPKVQRHVLAVREIERTSMTKAYIDTARKSAK